MSITSFQFVFFSIATIVVYRIMTAQYRWLVLLVSSIVFYVSFSVDGVFVLTVTALVTWFFAILIQNQKDKLKEWLTENNKTASKEERKAITNRYEQNQKIYLVIAVAMNFAILFFCKYYGILAININETLGVGLWTAENIILPLGISYYSLQLIGYITDVERDSICAETNPLKVILYGVFFLSIMQGPFNRYGDLVPQICGKEQLSVNLVGAKKATFRILWGYVKKMCIADQVGILANEVFANFSQYSSAVVLLGVICFAVQLYADFSGYMDIVIGIGELLGLHLPENFRQPFFSRNISEFWRRWHITLGVWLKDYVLYPVLRSKPFQSFGKWLTKQFGKKLGRSVPTNLGLLISWILIGAWHGAGLNYVFGVGILQFIYVIAGELTMPFSRKVKAFLKIDEKKALWHIFQSLRVTCLMLFAWVFFNSSSIGSAWQLVTHVVKENMGLNRITDIFSGSSALSGVSWILFILYIAVCIAVLLLVDVLHEKEFSIGEYVISKGYFAECLLVFGLLFSLVIFGAYGSQYNPSNFIYFKF